MRILCLAIALSSALSLQGDVRVLAEVGPHRVTLADFTRLLRSMQHSGVLADALKTMQPRGREAILDEVVQKRLFALRARETGLDRRPEVQAEIDDAVTAILAARFADDVAGPAALTEAAVRQYYDTHVEEFRAGGRVKVRHILVKSATEAQAVAAALATGEAFEQAAAEKSVDAATRGRGGELGWVPRGVMVKPFEDLVFALMPGEIGTVRTNFGVHVVRVDEVEPGGVPAFPAVREAARQKLAAATLVRWKRELMGKYRVTVHQDVLESIGR